MEKEDRALAAIEDMATALMQISRTLRIHYDVPLQEPVKAYREPKRGGMGLITWIVVGAIVLAFVHFVLHI